MSSKSLARAANSSDLEIEPGVVHDVDRVAAMAGGNTLGGYLFRYGVAQQPQWGKRIVLILSSRLVHARLVARPVAERVAACALMEFAHPHCRACGGGRELTIDKVKVTCPTCGGSGLHRHTDAERRAVLGVYGSRVAVAMSRCLSYLSDALGAFLGRAAGRLE